MTTNNSAAPAVNTEGTVNPFLQKRHDKHINAGTVAIESQRAVAEVQGKLTIAKSFPRNEQEAFADVIQSCKRWSFADQAMYSFPRGGQAVTGPSIRMAEELARCWGNIEYGTRELSRREGESEIEAYAWDQQKNITRSVRFTVKHLRDKKGGAVPLTDERDIYELIANMAGRRVRACLLNILPADYVDGAVEECKRTLKDGGTDLLIDRVRKALVVFASAGVTNEMIERRFNKKTTEFFPEDLAELTEIRNSIRDGHSSVSDWFGEKTDVTSGEKITAESLKLKAESKEQLGAGDTKANAKTETVDVAKEVKVDASLVINEATTTTEVVEKGQAPIKDPDDDAPIL